MHVDDGDAEVLAALAAHMQRILDELRVYGRTGARWETAEDSPATYEHSRLERHFGPGSNWNGDASAYVADAGLLFLLAQADHLAVLQQTYDTYVGLMFGVAPPARSLLEINGYVFWLLHPDISSVRVRAARALLAQTNNARRERSAAKSLGAPTKVLEPLVHTVKALKDRAAAEFYPTEIWYDKHGNLHLLGERHPGPGEALRHLSVAGSEDWNSRGAYAFLSNASHPTLHVITDTIQLDAEGKAAHFGHSDTVFHYRLARLAMNGLLSTWELNAAYRGLDRSVPSRLASELEALPEPSSD